MLSFIARSKNLPCFARVNQIHTSSIAFDNTIVSSAPKGTVLKGIQFLKDKPEPIALDDSEYPGWLWDLLDEKKLKQKTSKPVNRQYHRKQNREAIKASNFMKDKKN
ncbi:mitochondrial ribosomal protein L37-domain-containing protein [Sporodiniella umbellata]|nr:mitochondrial ribosomal protein L37-domain-containing protein [Sporodiniella umbellata]